MIFKIFSKLPTIITEFFPINFIDSFEGIDTKGLKYEEKCKNKKKLKQKRKIDVILNNARNAKQPIILSD